MSTMCGMVDGIADQVLHAANPEKALSIRCGVYEVRYSWRDISRVCSVSSPRLISKYKYALKRPDICGVSAVGVIPRGLCSEKYVYSEM